MICTYLIKEEIVFFLKNIYKSLNSIFQLFSHRFLESCFKKFKNKKLRKLIYINKRLASGDLKGNKTPTLGSHLGNGVVPNPKASMAAS